MRSIALASSLLLGVATSVSAGDGEDLFNANGCPACHHPTENRVEKGLGPSLTGIAEAYRGEPRALVEFLRGDADPRLHPDKYPLMKAQLARLINLSESELRALAEHLLSF